MPSSGVKTLERLLCFSGDASDAGVTEPENRLSKSFLK